MKSMLQKIIREVLKVLSEKEKDALLRWAEECKKVVDSGLTKIAKMLKLTGITRRNHAALKSVFNLIWKNLQKHLWRDRSFTARFAVAGVGLGILLGGGSVGIALGGTAFGMPFLLVTAVGATFLGMLIEEIRRGKSK